MTNIIKNNSQGYGYNYASLSDIASQGIEIPKMKTGTDELNGKDYIYYWDSELNQWIRGAEIIPTENKSMNPAQNYASGVTYARRVTTQLAKQLACTDDEDVENTNADGSTKTRKDEPKASQKQVEYIKKLYSESSQAEIVKHYQLEKLDDITVSMASELIKTAQEKQKEKIKVKEKKIDESKALNLAPTDDPYY